MSSDRPVILFFKILHIPLMYVKGVVHRYLGWHGSE